jgi:DNA-binding CsgD family transcriptional regulator
MRRGRTQYVRFPLNSRMDGTGRIVLELYRAARESPMPEFQERAISALKTQYRFDSSVGATARLLSHGIEYQSIDLFNLSDAFVTEHATVADEDILAREIAKTGGRVCTITMRELMPARSYPRVAAFDARFGMQNVLGQMRLDPVTHTLSGILLWRSKARDRYTEDERRLGEVLLPQFIEACAVNRIVWLSELTASTIARRGVRAIANDRGIVHTYDESFLDLVRREWPDWSPPFLPEALLSVLRASPQRRYSGAEIAVACEFRHGMLFLLAREKSRAFGLTPGQLSVARLIADGKTYKETATQLDLSVATVRNHLHTAYRKLSVRNKTALAKLLSHGA